MKTKRFACSLTVFVFILSLCAFFSACSKDDEINSPTRASIEISHELTDSKSVGARSLGSDVKYIMYYCYNVQGLRTFGPTSRQRAHKVLLQAVPLQSTSIGMFYYNSNDELIGFYSQPTELKAGETYEINNPEWEDIDSVSSLEGLDIAQDDGTRVHKGNQAYFYAMGRFKRDDNRTYLINLTDFCTWSSSDTNVLDTKDSEGNEASHKGQFYALNTGKASIKATLQNMSGVSDEIEAEVTDAFVTSVALQSKSLTLPISLPYALNPLTATWSDGKTTDVSLSADWRSSDTDRVLVSAGAIFPKNKHTEGEEATLISASYDTVNADGEAVSLLDSCSVTVVDGNLTGIRLEVEPLDLSVGSLADVSVYGIYSVSGSTAEFEIDDRYKLVSSDTAVLEVGIDDEVVAKAEGTAILTVTSTEDSSLTDSVTVSVSDGEGADSGESGDEPSADASEEPSVEASEN